MDIAEELRSTTENGADPDLIYRAADEIARLRGEAGVLRGLLMDAYNYLDPSVPDDRILRDQIDAALKGAAIEAEVAQEPVAWVEPDHLAEMRAIAGDSWQNVIACTRQNTPKKIPLYTSPQPVDKQLEALRDPAVLHVNLLRGLPAQLTKAQLLHLLGTDAPDDAQQVAVPQEPVMRLDGNGVPKWLPPHRLVRERITDGKECWCNPEVNYIDPTTGVAVIVHHKPN